MFMTFVEISNENLPVAPMIAGFTPEHKPTFQFAKPVRKQMRVIADSPIFGTNTKER